jgi:DNA gyrase subunit A
VNKANLLIRIGELVRDKKLDGISDLRDESDKSGMRVVIELKRGEIAEIVQNNLFKLTQLQDSWMNMVALVDGAPRLLNRSSSSNSSCSTAARSSCGARASSCARRARSTYWRASRSRCPTSTRSSRSSGGAHAAGGEGRADGEDVALAARRGHAETRGGGYRAAGGSAARIRIGARERLPVVRCAGAGDPRAAAAALTGLEQDKIFSEYKEVMAQIVD